MSEIRVFSGIQPSGDMHLGNYLGAVRQWVENQGKGKQNFYCIVDLHAHTILRDSQELRDNTRSFGNFRVNGKCSWFLCRLFYVRVSYWEKKYQLLFK